MMKKVLSSLAMAYMLLTLTSCGAAKQFITLSALEGEWNIIEINGSKVQPTAGQKAPYISFETTSGKLAGNSGCNRMMGSFDINAQPGSLELSEIAGTRMLCGDMTLEKNVLNVLKNVKGYKKLDNGNMALTNASNRPIVVLEMRTNNDQVNLLNGKWLVVEASGEVIPTGTDTNRPFIEFDVEKKSISGNAGCNGFNGRFVTNEQNAQAISFPAVAATMKACLDMTVERLVLNGLNEVASFDASNNNRISFLDKEGKTVLVLERG
ncbi:META domain-containing protein [Bacteroides sp. 214]|nr:META domain-containing protein [Bacteroides sp. 214]NDW11803.1 META domain-containing protein [Bacteroides sp. 214]